MIPAMDDLLAGLEGSAAAGEMLEMLDLPVALLARPKRRGELRFLHANSAMSRLCGYPIGELVGQTPRMLQGQETDVALARQFRCDIDTCGHAFTSLVNYRKDGSPYEVLLLGAKLERENETPERDLYLCISHLLDEPGTVPARSRQDSGTVRRPH